MKKAVLSLLSLLLVVALKAQSWSPVTFDDTSWHAHIIIDPVQNRNNLWQVGHPQKNLLTSAVSYDKSIVTDTINSYPVNDTSSFEFICPYISTNGYPYHVELSGFYFINTDTLKDYAKIEVSFDHGSTWIDFLNDPAYAAYRGMGTKPVFSGNTSTWRYFSLDLFPLIVHENFQLGDTLRCRFSFVSDSIQTNKDGAAFDDIAFTVFTEGVSDPKYSDLVSVYPNPANNHIVLRNDAKAKLSKLSADIYDITGKLWYHNEAYSWETIATDRFPNGSYLIRFSDGKNVGMKKLLVQH